jgi:hypothetical protein
VVARLATAYAGRSDLPLVVLAIDPGDAVEIDALRSALRSAEVDEVHLALPATLSVPAASATVDELARLALTGIVLTRVDESECVGGLLEVSIRRRLPIGYVLGEIFAAADPRRLAAMILP